MHIEEALGRATEGNPNIDGEGFNLDSLDPAGDQQTQSRLGWRSSQPADPGCCRRIPESRRKATWLTTPR